MSTSPVENTPHHSPLGADGFNPVSPQADEGYGTVPAQEGLVGRHVDPDAKPDAFREDQTPVDSGTSDTFTPVPETDSVDDHVNHPDHHEHHVEGESLTEHKPGESFKEWIAADVQQTKEDLHIGKKHD
jgi:hypothetical protein